MAFRNTYGIVTNTKDAEAVATAASLEADVIMTAALLGFTAWRVGDPADTDPKTKGPTVLAPTATGLVQFDCDVDPDDAEDLKGLAELAALKELAERVQHAVGAYLKAADLPPVTAGSSPSFIPGAVVMGVNAAAGQTIPALSDRGTELWLEISTGKDKDGKPVDVTQYTGRGAYTGFVDGPHGPVGPLSTARFNASAAKAIPVPRWLPPQDSVLWANRRPTASKTDPKLTPFSWGLILGDKAKQAPLTGLMEDKIHTHDASFKNLAEQGTAEMRDDYHMVFAGGDVPNDDVAMYTHGLVQAIYQAHGQGPGGHAYEIAVGSLTTKMASCFTCSMFMSATGYFPNSIHLGRGESWTPLFAPYEAGSGKATLNDIDDLNTSWYQRCDLWLRRGLTILTKDVIADPAHAAAREAVVAFLDNKDNDGNFFVAATLILDAVTVHDSESNRVLRTLKPLALKPLAPV